MIDGKPDPGEIRHFRLPDLAGAAERRPDAEEGPNACGSEAGVESAPRLFSPLPLTEDGQVPGGLSGEEGDPEEGRAETLLAVARQEAEALLAQARGEADGLREAAHREGIEAGRAEGRRRLEESAERLAELVRELTEYKEGLYQEARTQTLELVFAVLGKIMGPLAEADEQVVVRVTERALQLLSDREVLTLRVHPDDLKSLVEAKPQILETFDGIQKLTVLEDPSVRRGGCIVQTPSAEIDARLDSQLQEVARRLRNP